MGNLLYVDSRQAGFSYSQTRLGERESDALHDLTAIDDAMDYVRALLVFYEKFPVLSDKPLIIVGESYGEYERN
jgi:carboxypeptidase C (cathepsin A)